MRARSPSSGSPTSCAGARPRTPRTSLGRRRRSDVPCGSGRDDANPVLGLGSLALIRHEFRDALRYGRRAERLLPGSYRPYGVTGDALVELGRYDEAFAAFDRMISLRPSLASYARVAYARELVGDRRGALAAMQLALTSAAGQPEPTAWAHVELSKLERALGRLGQRSRRHATAALRALPGYPSARVELAQVDAADGDLRGAIRAAGLAAEATPTAQAVALLGDLLERAGRPDAARRQRATVAVIDRLLAANGVRADLETAVYRADNAIRPDGDGGPRPARTCRSTVDLRRRCARLGARPCGSLPRGDPVARPLAPAGNARRPPVLPPRLRGTLRGRCRRWACLVHPSARPERGVLRALGAGRPGIPLRLERPHADVSSAT